MAVYKVPQDVEAEDKFFGPFSFKQFLFFGGVAVSGYLVFLTLTKGVWPLSIIFLVPMLIFGVLAFPWSKEQPTELWLAAHIRFMFMKRKRIWDQSGMKELVTITAPKKEVHALTDGLSQDEVRTRFNTLASVIDTRGWAVKNVLQNGANSDDESDRLVQATELPSAGAEEEILANAPDVMDEVTNPLAKQFDTLMEDSKNKHRDETLAMIEEARQYSDDELTSADRSPIKNTGKHRGKPTVNAQDMWYLQENQTVNDPNYAHFKNSNVVKPGEKPLSQFNKPEATPIKIEDEKKLLDKVHKQRAQDAAIKQQSHMKTIQPLSTSSSTIQGDDSALSNATASQDNAQASSATPVDPAIISLANNDDLSVETLARQAHKGTLGSEEVVISLH